MSQPAIPYDEDPTAVLPSRSVCGVAVNCDQVIAPAPLGRDGVPAVIAILVLLGLVIVFDVWALHTQHRTISQLLQRFSRAWWWFKWLGITALAFLAWHVFQGFPW